jgi:hypothetical protein
MHGLVVLCRKRETPSTSTSTGVPGRKRSSVTPEERISRQIGHLTSALGFHTLESLAMQVQAVASELPTTMLVPTGSARTPQHHNPAHGLPSAKSPLRGYRQRHPDRAGATATVANMCKPPSVQPAFGGRLQDATRDPAHREELSISSGAERVPGQCQGSATYTSNSTMRCMGGARGVRTLAINATRPLMFTPSWDVQPPVQPDIALQKSGGKQKRPTLADHAASSAGGPTLAQQCTGTRRSKTAARLWQELESADHNSERSPELVEKGRPGSCQERVRRVVQDEGRTSACQGNARPRVGQDPRCHLSLVAGKGATMLEGCRSVGLENDARTCNSGALASSSRLRGVDNAAAPLSGEDTVLEHSRDVAGATDSMICDRPSNSLNGPADHSFVPWPSSARGPEALRGQLPSNESIGGMLASDDVRIPEVPRGCQSGAEEPVCEAGMDEDLTKVEAMGGCQALGPPPSDAEAVVLIEALCTHTATLAARGLVMQSVPGPLVDVLASIRPQGQCIVTGGVSSWAAGGGTLCKPVLDSAVAQLRGAQQHLSVAEQAALDGVLKGHAAVDSTELLQGVGAALVDRTNDLLGQAYSLVLRATDGGAVAETFRLDDAEATLAFGVRSPLRHDALSISEQ